MRSRRSPRTRRRQERVLHRCRHHQWDTVPAAQLCLITSAEKLISKGVTDTITTASKGAFEGLQTLGQAGLFDYHDFDATIPADVKTKVADIVKQMEAGTLKTGVT